MDSNKQLKVNKIQEMLDLIEKQILTTSNNDVYLAAKMLAHRQLQEIQQLFTEKKQ